MAGGEPWFHEIRLLETGGEGQRGRGALPESRGASAPRPRDRLRCDRPSAERRGQRGGVQRCARRREIWDDQGKNNPDRVGIFDRKLTGKRRDKDLKQRAQSPEYRCHREKSRSLAALGMTISR